MANFTLTGANNDQLLGAADQADAFFLAAPGRLVGGDTVQGGGGAGADQLRITSLTTVTLAAADFANTRDIERIVIFTAAGADITLLDAMVASSDFPDFSVFGFGSGDTVYGGGVLATALVLDGAAGDDLLEGGGGNDLIAPGSGADTAFGGGGADTVDLAFAEFGANDRFDGGDGIDDLLRLTGGGGVLGAAAFAALARFERIELDPAIVAALNAQVAASYVTGGAPLTIAAAAGNDTLSATAANLAVVLRGEAGNDRLVGGVFADTLQGGDGNDRLSGGSGNDLILAGAGNDTVSAGIGNDTIEAGTGADRMEGGAGNDLYRFAPLAFDTADLITDESGTLDTIEFTGVIGYLIATTASSRIAGIERFVLTDGGDVFTPSNALTDGLASGAMTVEGGAGNDRIDLSATSWLLAPARFLLQGGAGADTLIGDDGADTLDGGGGGGVLRGGAANDLLLAGVEELALAPILDGGADFADVLRVIGEGSIGAAELANVAGIEIIELASPASLGVPQAVINAMSSASLDFTARGSAGDDTVAATGLNAGTDLLVELGAGDDSFVGGAGDETVQGGAGIDSIQLGTGGDRAAFGANELTALDTVGADALVGDSMYITLANGRTLPATAFAGVTGIDEFYLEDTGGTVAVRLPGNLVTQSGQSQVTVDGIGDADLVVDGRAVTGAMLLLGGNGNDLLFGATGADTLTGSSGEDTLAGGDGGDAISLGSGGTERDLALIIGQFDGTSDMNGSISTSSADRVTGLAFEGNFIAVDWQRLGLPNSTTLVISAGQDVELGYGAVRFSATETIDGNLFGSLTEVAEAVGSRITNNQVGVDERIILVIGGQDGEEFAVYLFEDRDDNATVNSADGLYLLAIGDTGVPIGLGPGRGFTMTSLDVL